MPQAQTYQSEFTGVQMDERFRAVATLAEALTVLEQAIAAKYTKPASGIPSTDMDTAVQNALALALTSVQSLADYYTKSEVDAMVAAVNAQEYIDVATLPAASADTLGKIYLVGPTSGEYARYITTVNGSTYGWVQIGTTEISMANYATKAELSQLDQKVNGFSAYTAGKYLKTNGTTGDNADYCVSDYINVEGCTKLKFIVSSAESTSNVRMVEYNSGKSYVDNWGYNYNDTAFNKNANTVFVRLSYLAAETSPKVYGDGILLWQAETPGLADDVSALNKKVADLEYNAEYCEAKKIAPASNDWHVGYTYNNNTFNVNANRSTYFINNLKPGTVLRVKAAGSPRYTIGEFAVQELTLNTVSSRLVNSGWRDEKDYTVILGNSSHSVAIILESGDTSLVYTAISSLEFVEDKVSGYVTGEKVSLEKQPFNRSLLGAFELGAGGSYFSAFDVYGDYLLAVYPQSGNVCNGSLYRLSTQERICDISFPVGDYEAPHANVACFGKDFYNENQELPLFYISQWNGAGGCLVYNIVKESDTVYTASLVQAIMPSSDIDESVFGQIARGDFLVDIDNGFLYSIRYLYDSSYSPVDGDVNYMMLTKFEIPDTSLAEVSLTDADILENFAVPAMPINQDKKIWWGKMYVSAGMPTEEGSQRLYVVDLGARSIVSCVDLSVWAGEPEGFTVIDGAALMSYYGGANGNKIYKLRFL